MTLSLGQTVDLPLKMQVGGLTETVQVVGAPAIVDTRTTTSGANFTAKCCSESRSAATSGRHAVPGAGRQQLRHGRGGEPVDRRRQRPGQPVRHRRRQRHEPGLRRARLLLDRVRLARQRHAVRFRAGSAGEDRRLRGRVRPGDRRRGQRRDQERHQQLHGSVFGYARPSGLEGDWTQYQSANGSVQTESAQISDGGVEGGGPDHQERCSSSAPSIRRTRRDDAPGAARLPAPRRLGDVDRTCATTVLTRRRRPGSLATRTGSTPRSSATRRRATTGRSDVARCSSPTPRRSARLTYGGHNQTVRYNGVLSNNWLVEGTCARALNAINEMPSVDTWRVTDQHRHPERHHRRHRLLRSGQRSLNNQFSVKIDAHVSATTRSSTASSSTTSTYSQINQRTGPTFTAPDGRQTATGAQIDDPARSDFGQDLPGDARELQQRPDHDAELRHLFAQDTWRVGDRLTINPGIRYEQEKMAGTIVTDFTLKNNWAPRLGATYDITGDGKTKRSATTAASTRASRTTWRRGRCRPTTASAAPTTSTPSLTRPIPNGTCWPASVTNHFLTAGRRRRHDRSQRQAVVHDEYAVRRRARGHGEHQRRRPLHLAEYRRVLEDVANCPMVAYDLACPGCGSVEYILTNPSAPDTGCSRRPQFSARRSTTRSTSTTRSRSR